MRISNLALFSNSSRSGNSYPSRNYNFGLINKIGYYLNKDNRQIMKKNKELTQDKIKEGWIPIKWGSNPKKIARKLKKNDELIAKRNKNRDRSKVGSK